jgi:serine phosphatase RsbU (regulator of sigma subunit)
MFSHDDKMYCATDFGMYRLDQGQFQMTTEFGVDFKETKQGVHRINADPNGNVWMVLFEDMENTYEIGYSAKSEGYVWHSEYFSGYDEYIAHAVFHQDANVTWIGGPGGLMSFDKRRVSDHAVEFNALIRSVNFGGEVLFGGSGLPRDNYELAFESKHKIEFSFAANTFKSEDKTQYSWMLEGFDEDWSAWSSMTKDDYSLQEGTYTFKVRAKNAKGEISEEAAFTFTILPPWYRTWWAYMLFVVVLILVVYALIRLSIHRVKQQNIKLEKIVEDRTQEVVAQKAEVEKQRDIAEHQKHLVEEKNLEILDSINYAKRLQNAILTPVKTIYDTFQESFILYLPKDIVAGDFYWTNLAKLNKRDSRNMIAAADCTGHGVPGAMVSVVCSNALDRSVKEFGLTQPAEVLDKVTDLVIETFEKSEDEVKDGMDIALCAFEEKEDHVELQYAGANNNLWIISEKKEMSVNQEHLEPVLEMEGMNLFEVKATKQPVGKYLDRKPFINNVVKLNQGDTIYLFTDGFADQFGGPKGKKYKYLPFKRFLISMQNKGLQDQMTGLSDEFYRWKGDIEQIDDVCVIGIRV